MHHGDAGYAQRRAIAGNRLAALGILLDRKSAGDILELLRRLNAEMGKTVIMVTHDWHAVESARHVVHLEKGELVGGDKG